MRQIITLVLVCIVVATAHGMNQATPEGYALGNIRTAVAHFGEDHSGHWPTNWNQIEHYVHLASINEVLISKGLEAIQRNYVFVPWEWNLTTRTGERIVVMRVKAVREDTRTPETAEGRYAIVLRTADFNASSIRSGESNNVHLLWLIESRAQEILSTAKRELPPPDLETARTSEEMVRLRMERQQQVNQEAQLIYYRLRIADAVKSVWHWISIPSTNSVSGDGSSVSRRLRAWPLAGVVLFPCGLAALFMRRRTRKLLHVVTYLFIFACASSEAADFPNIFERKERIQLEEQYAIRLRNALVYIANVFTNQPFTNCMQLYPGLLPEAWIKFEREFLQLREKKRGFQTSLWEKYVVIDLEVPVPARAGASGGSLVLLQAQAYNGSGRFAIWRSSADQEYEVGAFSEAEIQEWFSKAGREIPSPGTNLPPITPRDWKEGQERYERALSETFLEMNKAEGTTWWMLYKRRVFVGLAFTGAVVLGVIWYRRTLRLRVFRPEGMRKRYERKM